MSVVVILILVSLAVAVAFLGSFIWAVHNGQYDDTLTPSLRVLAEDDFGPTRDPAASVPGLKPKPGGLDSKPMKSTIKTAGQVAILTTALAATAKAADTQPTNWLDNTISPVANPIYFEDPRVTSEVRPIYMYHMLPDTFHFKGGSVPLGGQVQVMALQLRYALSDRLALIATKDGYIEFQPKNVLGHAYGWGDLAAGLKYAVVDDREKQLIVSPGFTITVPTGSTDVMQGHGSGEWNLFVSAEKGFDQFHVTGNAGFRIPNDFSQNTAQLHYSLQLDYYACQWFIPFFAANGYTILSNGDQKLLGVVPLNAEMYDLINFGATDAAGSTQFTVGGGLRTRLTKNVDAGVAYEAGVMDPKGIFDSRVTADVIWRF